MDSILTTIKSQFPIEQSDTSFDNTLITLINSVFSILLQLGVGPNNGFYITGYGEKWTDFIEGDPCALKDVKTYIYMKVRMMFDPPTNSAVLSATERMIAEYEWRLNVAVDPSMGV